MDALKKILTVMVVILVIIIVGGGLYMASMGSMNHGGGQVSVTSQNQKDGQASVGENTQTVPQTGTTPQTDSNSPPKDEKVNTGTQQSNSQSGSPAPTNQNNSPGQTTNAQVPVIIQVPPQATKTDPNLYVQQLKERLRSINEANSSIASNTGQSMIQPNSAAVPPGQSGMNQLHQGFYKLGQDVSVMGRTLDDLAQNLKENQPANQYGPQPAPNYPYVYPQNSVPFNYQYYYGYPNYPAYFNYPGNPTYQPYQPQVNQGQLSQNQSGPNSNQQNQAQPDPQQQMQPGQQHQTQPGQQSNSHLTNQSMNHSSPSNFLNANVFKTIFVLILIFSVIFGIVSVVGFIGSLFKDDSPKSNAGNRHVA